MFGTNKNKSKWMLVIAFLATVMGDLSANAQKLHAAGKINPRDADLAVRSKVKAGGTIDLLENAGQSQTRGVNDFDGNRLTNGKNFVIDAITINYGVGLDDAGAQNVDYSTALPPALKTANLIIKQNEKVVLRLSVASINEAKSTDARYKELGGFALLKEETTTQIELEFGQGADFGVAAGSSGHVEVLFSGFETHISR